MVAVLSTVEDHETAPPQLRPLLGNGGQLLELSLPKLSYCLPQPPILIARNGWKIGWAIKPDEQQAVKERAQADELAALRFIQQQLDEGKKHSKSSAEEQWELAGLSRNRLRAAIGRLLADGRLKLCELPEHEKHGGRTHYLKPIVEARP